MTYRNRVTRCPHGFAIGIVRCESCEERAPSFRKAYKGIKPRVVRDGIRQHGPQVGSYRQARGNV